VAATLLEIETRSAGETFAFGRRMAAGLRPGDIVAMTGDLGAGKTVLAQGLCAGLGVDEPVTSPTFTLVQEYRGRMPVRHLDFYRIERPGDLVELDLPGLFESGAVCLIEWAERGEGWYPDGVIRANLSVPDPAALNRGETRRLRLELPPERNWRGLFQ